jgi:hypothetical protein
MKQCRRAYTHNIVKQLGDFADRYELGMGMDHRQTEHGQKPFT